jgi:hypothetical protein
VNHITFIQYESKNNTELKKNIACKQYELKKTTTSNQFELKKNTACNQFEVKKQYFCPKFLFETTNINGFDKIL